MTNLYQKVYRYFQTRTLDQKILLLMFVVLTSASIIILFTSTNLAFRTITDQSQQLTTQQLTTISKNTAISLDNYDELMQILVLDSMVQTYLNAPPQERQVLTTTKAVFSTILNLRNTKEHINYVTLITADRQDFIYNGDTITEMNLVELLEQDYESAFQKEFGSLRYSITPSLNGSNRYSLNLYRPVYHQYILGKEIGLLCMSLDLAALTQFLEFDNTQMTLMTENGMTLPGIETGDIALPADFTTFSNDGGSFSVDDQWYSYSEIEEWNLFLVEVSPLQLFREQTNQMLWQLLVMVLILVLASLFFFRRQVHELYEPIRSIQFHMKKVSDGNFETRAQTTGVGKDFKEMGESFNTMVVRLDELVEHVKEDQRQIERIELNALQSQIKPHFLYNTLDCIHWQALADGNQQVSKLVKALANYYRLCLSRGQDIIPLSQELAHIKNYLIIQNLRYGDIIESDIDVAPQLQQVPMPKMTLQPLIENSIYHGIKIKNGQKGAVKITASQDGSDIIIHVADSGSGISKEEIVEINSSISEFDESFGYGVRNVHKRIEMIFGRGYGLFYTANETGGVTVDIKLPYRPS